MDGRSWSPRDAVRREDQFTAAPDFYDEHDSDHLPMWGRIAATWHGMGPARRVMVASSLLVIAGAFAAVVITLSASPGAGPSPGGGGPVGASEGGPSVPSGVPPVTLPDQPLDNVTATSSASGSPPLLPMPSFPPPVDS